MKGDCSLSKKKWATILVAEGRGVYWQNVKVIVSDRKDKTLAMKPSCGAYFETFQHHKTWRKVAEWLHWKAMVAQIIESWIQSGVVTVLWEACCMSLYYFSCISTNHFYTLKHKFMLTGTIVQKIAVGFSDGYTYVHSLGDHCGIESGDSQITE